jgi:ATP phosphoribosyltransferase regulatory subunit
VEYLKQHHGNVTVHVDLAEVRGYRYHSGLSFSAYTAGYGRALAQGGRYDNLCQALGGVPQPATGFTADLKALIAVAEEQGVLPKSAGAIWAPFSPDPVLRKKIDDLRRQGHRVITALPGQSSGSRDARCHQMLVYEGGHWRVTPIN